MNQREEPSDVTVRLTLDEALVLFDLLSRFDNTDKLSVEHPAEAQALSNLCCLLEKELMEPLKPEYRKLVEVARKRLGQGTDQGLKMNDPMESEYTHRPDAKGHLKVMALLRQWDPIGVITAENQDEYDGYSAAIVRMLDAGIPEKELLGFMKRIVTDSMGISCDEGRTREIAHELVEFWREWKGDRNQE